MELLYRLGLGGTSFYLPGMPPSAYSKKRHRRFDYVLAMQDYVPKLLTKHSDRYAIRVRFHHKFIEPKNDLDNMLKSLMDAIRPKAIYDDWHVRRITIETKFPSNKVGTEVTVWKI